MATVRERLAILIDADGKGAIREFEAVGRAADRSIGRTEDRLKRLSGQMTSFGVASVAASGVVAFGLGKAALAFEDAEMQQRKLSNSIANSSASFADNGKALRTLAQDLQKVTAADADAVVGAQSLLVQFGLTEAQVKTLTPLVVDLSRKMGIDVEAAAKAVGRSVNGSAGALGRMGITVDKAALAADGFNTTVVALSSTVGGFARAEGETFAGQLERFKNQLGDLQESVGKGALSVVGGLVDGMSSLAGASTESNGSLGEAAGRIGAIGVAGGLAVGTLSLLGGQVIKARDRFTTLGADGTRSLNGLGKAAKGVGVIMAGLAAVEIGVQVNDATEDTLRFETALRRLSEAVGERELGRQLKEMADSAEGVGDKFVDVFTRFDTIEVGGFIMDVDDLQEALDRLRDTDPEQLARVLPLVADAMQGLDVDDDANNRLRDHVKSLQDWVVASKQAPGNALSEVGEDADEAGGKIETATEKLRDFFKLVRGQTDPLFAVRSAGDDLDQARRKTEEVRKSQGVNSAEYRKAVEDETSAAQDFVEAQLGLAAAVKDNPDLLGQSIAQLDQLRDRGLISADTYAFVAQSFVDTAVEVQAVTGTPIDLNVDPAIGALDGLNGRLRETLGLIQLVAGVQAFLRSIPPSTIPIGPALPGQTIIPGYVGQPATIPTGPALPGQTIIPGYVGQPATIPTGPALPGQRIVPRRASGGSVSAGQMYRVNEVGQEMFVPNVSGYILPSYRTRGTDGASLGGTSVNIGTIVAPSPERVPSEIVRGMRRQAHLSGTR